MQGIELSKKCFSEDFLPRIREKMPEAEPYLAVGLVGAGSECFGFDDEISKDHDFSNGFYIWLTDETDIKYGVGLSRIYRECVTGVAVKSAALKHRGVITVDSFYMRYTGRRGLPESSLEWLLLPESALAEATNGEVFLDNVGAFTEMRNALLAGYPDNVFKKKLAARLIIMAQSGQYNYKRCLSHGERGAARLALSEFCTAALSAIFLLNGKYMPYYKWSLRAARLLERLLGQVYNIEKLLLCADESDCEALIEEICSAVAENITARGLSTAGGVFLEPHAYSVFDSISDRELRGLHIMEG